MVGSRVTPTGHGVEWTVCQNESLPLLTLKVEAAGGKEAAASGKRMAGLGLRLAEPGRQRRASPPQPLLEGRQVELRALGGAVQLGHHGSLALPHGRPEPRKVHLRELLLVCRPLPNLLPTAVLPPAKRGPVLPPVLAPAAATPTTAAATAVVSGWRGTASPMGLHELLGSALQGLEGEGRAGPQGLVWVDQARQPAELAPDSRNSVPPSPNPAGARGEFTAATCLRRELQDRPPVPASRGEKRPAHGHRLLLPGYPLPGVLLLLLAALIGLQHGEAPLQALRGALFQQLLHPLPVSGEHLQPVGVGCRRGHAGGCRPLPKGHQLSGGAVCASSLSIRPCSLSEMAGRTSQLRGTGTRGVGTGQHGRGSGGSTEGIR
mmetsp:Transcript_32480/g.92060  ORF Transcript_32480/g.92060 Transcript_32480/m.92060 type:complete len:377 (-) Transcript_32480:168-1298(-)